MVKIARNTAHILPNGTNTGPGVVQVDNSWTFGQVLAIVMIIVNFKEVVHYLWGEPARERQAQTEEVVHPTVGLRPQPATTFPLVPLIHRPHTSSALLHYTGFSTDTYTTHRGGMDMDHQAQVLQPFPGIPATTSGSGFRLTLSGQSHDQYTSGYTVYSSCRRSIVPYGR